MQGAKRDASSSYPVGQGRNVERDALGREGPALPGERQVHGELVADDHRQQARAGAPARDGMVRRRRLRDGLAGPAAELLPHRLHDLPLTGHQLQGLRHVLAQLHQSCATTARAGLGRGQHDPLARQVGRQRRPLGLAAGEGAHRGIAVVGFALARVLGRRCLQLLQLQFQLIQQLVAPFRGLAVPLSTQLRDLQPQMLDFRLGAGGAGFRRHECRAQGGVLGGGVGVGVGGGGRHGRE